MVKSRNVKYELHAYGKLEVMCAKQAYLDMSRWINVLDIETGYKFGDIYIIVYFERVSWIYTSFMNAKLKVRKQQERRQMLQKLMDKQNVVENERAMYTCDTKESANKKEWLI